MGSSMNIKLLLVLIILQVTGLPVCQSADIQSMNTTIHTYFSEARHHETNKEYKWKARKFIHDKFKGFGLDTEYQEFFDSKYPKVTFANIIGVLRGERFGQVDDRILGVAAHYDTMPNTPGVDDNGAGVAAMLEVVRQVTEANKRNNTIMFISFDAEELSFIGGYSFTKNWIGPYLVKHYGPTVAPKLLPYGIIVMDTMMNYDTKKQSQNIPEQYKQMFQQYFPEASANIAKDNFEGDFLLLTYRKPTSDSALAASFVSAWNEAGSPQFEIESFPLALEDPDDLNREEALCNFMRSDHVALWYDKIPAIFISDSANYRGKMEQCYHKACDNLQMLTDDNLKFLGKTADAITATLNTLSEASGGASASTTTARSVSKASTTTARSVSKVSTTTARSISKCDTQTESVVSIGAVAAGGVVGGIVFESIFSVVLLLVYRHFRVPRHKRTDTSNRHRPEENPEVYYNVAEEHVKGAVQDSVDMAKTDSGQHEYEGLKQRTDEQQYEQIKLESM